jgi:hypothetical protein
MNLLHKVLVVDSGERDGFNALSADLAELGLSSVTTSYEATNDVLDVIETPSAVLLQMPRDKSGPGYDGFRDFAEELRERLSRQRIPVIEWDRMAVASVGGLAAVLSRELGFGLPLE